MEDSLEEAFVNAYKFNDTGDLKQAMLNVPVNILRTAKFQRRLAKHVYHACLLGHIFIFDALVSAIERQLPSVKHKLILESFEGAIMGNNLIMIENLCDVHNFAPTNDTFDYACAHGNAEIVRYIGDKVHPDYAVARENVARILTTGLSVDIIQYLLALHPRLRVNDAAFIIMTSEVKFTSIQPVKCIIETTDISNIMRTHCFVEACKNNNDEIAALLALNWNQFEELEEFEFDFEECMNAAVKYNQLRLLEFMVNRLREIMVTRVVHILNNVLHRIQPGTLNMSTIQRYLVNNGANELWGLQDSNDFVVYRMNCRWRNMSPERMASDEKFIHLLLESRMIIFSRVLEHYGVHGDFAENTVIDLFDLE